ncbi:MAG: tRNA epoxyqueuosine(34) reductase QueG [Chitinophagales bacterium]
MNSLKSKYAHQIKQAAYQMGFQYVGISKAEFLEEEAANLEEWLQRGYHGKMTYMENHFDKRLDPTKLVEGAKSVITLLYNYETPKKQEDETAPKISKYAYGKDYHFVIKDKLKSLLQWIEDEIGEVGGRCFVDSAPVLERAWAAKSGVGWVGKHSLLITRPAGSYFFLAELIIDLELEADGPIKDYCGTCTRCIDACPTGAIVGDKIVDGSKCISYFTIELKDEIPTSMAGKFDNWMFGCDVCQQVCPWNRFAKPHQEPAFEPHSDLLKLNKREWQELTREVFNEIFRKSAVKRTKFAGLKRNIQFLNGNSD